mmetsp:Transcript_14690/g.25012  ORF Transcript_14690/g.25012 Transcript_14690/m.25012 type:complete len:222 (-) Transcript_14690:767-1432(-)
MTRRSNRTTRYACSWRRTAPTSGLPSASWPGTARPRLFGATQPLSKRWARDSPSLFRSGAARATLTRSRVQDSSPWEVSSSRRSLGLCSIDPPRPVDSPPFSSARFRATVPSRTTVAGRSERPTKTALASRALSAGTTARPSFASSMGTASMATSCPRKHYERCTLSSTAPRRWRQIRPPRSPPPSRPFRTTSAFSARSRNLTSPRASPALAPSWCTLPME